MDVLRHQDISGDDKSVLTANRLKLTLEDRVSSGQAK
jgi:hypothetical protein